MLFLTALRVANPVVRTDDRASPIAALNHVPGGIARTPVFNDYDFGGHLIFKGIHPFIDGRADMYGDDFLSAYIAALRLSPHAFQKIAENYGIRWTIMSADSPLSEMLDSLPGWKRVYSDRIAVVHVRTDAKS